MLAYTAASAHARHAVRLSLRARPLRPITSLRTLSSQSWACLSLARPHSLARVPTPTAPHLQRRSIHFQPPTTQPPTAVLQTFPDPSRPDLFYHLIAPPTPASAALPAFALSFLSTPPKSTRSSTIVGWLPAAAEGGAAEGVEAEAGAESGLNDFVQNPKFLALLHDAIREGLREDVDDIQRNGAIQAHQGWMHIHDSRNIPALGRIGDPDDIIASVLVEDGKMLHDTYQPMPSYRLCTADGLTQLTPGLAQKLHETLVARAAEECLSS